MSILERELIVDGSAVTVDALVRSYVGHMYWSIRDLLKSKQRLPSDASLVRAARLLEATTPAEIGKTAAWLELLDTLATAGLTDLERLQVLLEVWGERSYPGGMLPSPAVFSHAVAPLSAEQVRPVAGLLDADPPRGNALIPLVCALPLLEAGGPPPAALDKAYLFWAPPSVARRVLETLDPERREAVLLGITRTTSSNAARFMLENIWFVLDLYDTPALRDAVRAVREVSADYPKVAELHAKLDAGPPTYGADGISEAIRPSLDYWGELRAEAGQALRIGEVAEPAAAARVPVPGVAELASLDAWAAASDARRDAVAQAVLAAIGDKAFTRAGMTDGEPPIAVFQHKKSKVLLSLVPGGAFDQGLTAEEEEAIRTRVATAGFADQYEEYGQLIDHLDTMRPVRRVSVGPMLIGQRPGKELEPSAVGAWVKSGPFRLPTESEWEYAARGGQPAQLTWRGNDLPLEKWFKETRKLKAKAANRFGLWGFGEEPEVCADCWRPTYDGAPTDGSPVAGPGPRVVRGGAAQIHPWQACGEWHLLLVAMRGSQEGWDYVLAARPVIGLAIR